jgi:hypothetical protein
MASVRTVTHTYPQEEVNAMTDFYGGKRCVISLTLPGVHWGHTLDAALGLSNTRASQYPVSCTIMLTMCPLAFSNAYPQSA